MTSTAGVIIAWNTGTIANTGGATSPLRCAGIGSLVASAYALIRSCVTSNRSSSLQRFRPLSSNATSGVSCWPMASGVGSGEFAELRECLVELFGAVLLDGLAERALDQ